MLSFLEHIPERLYLFSVKSNGGYLYFKDAYDAELALCESTWGIAGAQLFCTKLLIWRELFHLGGGVLIAFAIHYLRKRLGKAVAFLLTLLLFAYIVFQEFYVHPITYSQVFQKGLMDVVVWSLPLTIYWAIEAFRSISTRKK